MRPLSLLPEAPQTEATGPTASMAGAREWGGADGDRPEWKPLVLGPAAQVGVCKRPGQTGTQSGCVQRPPGARAPTSDDLL